MSNSSIVLQKRAPTAVILNGAQRSEESKVSIREAAMSVGKNLGFFAQFILSAVEGLRMTLVGGLVTSCAYLRRQESSIPTPLYQRRSAMITLEALPAPGDTGKPMSLIKAP